MIRPSFTLKATPLETERGTDWRDQAACIGHKDPDLWHQPPSDLYAAGTAKAICATCPVNAECLAWAVETGQSGIWGGTTDEERSAMVKRRKAANRAIDHGTPAGARTHQRRGEKTCALCLAAARAARAK